MEFRGEAEPVVRVGTGIIVVKEQKVLVGKRKGSHAAGLVSFPGGHLDFGETWEQCLKRELTEECGPDFTVLPIWFDDSRVEWFVTNDIMPQYNKHYITIFMMADWMSGDPVNMEPDKCEGWEWWTFEQLKEAVNNNEAAQWIPIRLIEQHRYRIGI